MKIAVFGTGYVGLVTGACLSNLGHEVLCIDIDEHKIASLMRGELTFYEPGLLDLVQRNREKNRLRFSTVPKEGIEFASVIFNCVGTPGQSDGSADLSYVFSVAQNVAQFANGPKTLVNKSTVPPGTAQNCANIIEQVQGAHPISVVSNPEFLAEGKAIHDFTHPDKIVVGAKNEESFGLLRKVYTGRVRTYIPLIETDWETAEMIKYANNSFLATKISFINEMANICDHVGADVRLISQAIGMDYRICAKFLNPGVGYGGSCFPKDVRALIRTARANGYEAKLLNEVDLLNERQKDTLFTMIRNRFGSDLKGHHFSVLGLSFKPKTSDIREAPSLVLIEQLLHHGAQVQVYDPVAMEEVKEEIGAKVTYCNSIEECTNNSSALLVVTEWDEFRNIDLRTLGKQMKSKIVFDGRNIYEPELVREDGFEYYGIGRR